MLSARPSIFALVIADPGGLRCESAGPRNTVSLAARKTPAPCAIAPHAEHGAGWALTAGEVELSEDNEDACSGPRGFGAPPPGHGHCTPEGTRPL